MDNILGLIKKLNKKVLNFKTVIITVFVLLAGLLLLASVVTYNLKAVTDWSSFISTVGSEFWNLIIYLVGGAKAASITHEGWLSIGIFKVIFKTILSTFGILVTGFTVAAITSYLVEKVLRRLMGMGLPTLAGHTLVCGWNSSADLIVKRIHDEDPDEPIVLVCDRAQAPRTGKNLYWVKGDHTKADILEKAHIKKAITAIVLADTDSAGGSKELADARTILSVLTIENIHPDIHSAAELLDPSNKGHLNRANVDEIVISGELSGTILSRVSENKGLSKIVKSLLQVGDGSEIYRVEKIPETAKTQTFGELYIQIYQNKNYILFGFEDASGEFHLSPPSDSKLDVATALYIISEEKPVL
ncbi:MAG: NAD-binding protein [Caldisericia bacterium]|nr:NAD-binding protein [Caldisericia bacterium]